MAKAARADQERSKQRLHPEIEKHKRKPGQSGNPKGRVKPARC